ncbi:predicted protein [Streptomyces filamentosus NRRL 15998]|uniref:Predicted protein n=1 Tax=Streptomyces filamentosus NRRL 15998 TaxID=457431 RepID=D6AT44_STRFL|nr:predicted protein [Streptomyces filamentosus NRRL 15998]
MPLGPWLIRHGNHRIHSAHTLIQSILTDLQSSMDSRINGACVEHARRRELP